jgi:hypothetical protein
MRFDKPIPTLEELRAILVTNQTNLAKFRAKGLAGTFGVLSGTIVAAGLAMVWYYSTVPSRVPLWLGMAIGYSLCIAFYYLYGRFGFQISASELEARCKKALASEQSMRCMKRLWLCTPLSGEHMQFSLIENVGDQEISGEGWLGPGNNTQHFVIVGRTTDTRLEMTMEPRVVIRVDGEDRLSNAERDCGTLHAIATLKADGIFTGEWRSESGLEGTFKLRGPYPHNG